MLDFPNCKINLGLKILSKRTDGFHNIETVFYPVPLKDALEIIPSHLDESVTFTSSGYPINGPAADNLCIKAYQILKKDFPHLPSVKIHLHKNIPMGAGLGGGSADASFTLKMLNKQFKLQLSDNKLTAYALQIGSDCPFFIINQPCTGTSQGEMLQPVNLNLSAYNIVLVNPKIHINTKDAFNALNLNKPDLNHIPVHQIIAEPVATWKQNLVNDFETPIFLKYPAIKAIKETLYQSGATYAAMSGSGSTVFGLFLKDSQPIFHFNEHYFITQLSL